MDQTEHHDIDGDTHGSEVATSPHDSAGDGAQKSDPDFSDSTGNGTGKKSPKTKPPVVSRSDVDSKRNTMAEQLTAATAEHDQLKARMAELDARKARNDKTIAERRADNAAIGDEQANVELMLSAQAAFVGALEKAVPTLAKSKLREGRRTEGQS